MPTTPDTPTVPPVTPDTVTPCPPWCEQLQCQEVLPADRFHQQEVTVPVIFRSVTRRSDETHELQISAEATDLNIVRFTSATEHDDIWVAIQLEEAGSQSGVTLTVESAERLLRELASLLAPTTPLPTQGMRTHT